MGGQGRRFQHGHAVGSCVHLLFGFPRSGEATLPSASAYDPGDRRCPPRSAPSKILVHIKASKTDQFLLGVTICLGRTEQELCPVEALLSYTSRRGLAPGPIFRHEDGQPLTYVAHVREIQAALGAAGLHAVLFAGHSFRIYRSGHVDSGRWCGGRSYKTSR